MRHDTENTKDQIEWFHRSAKDFLEGYNDPSKSRELRRVNLRLALNFEWEAMNAEDALVYEIDTGN